MDERALARGQLNEWTGRSAGLAVVTEAKVKDSPELRHPDWHAELGQFCDDEERVDIGRAE
ncbi:MAG: hypothetical protein WC048_18040 [Rhizobium sp.]